MYVCVCNALRERDVRQVLNRLSEPQDAHRALGCQPRCGRCLKDILRMIEAETKTVVSAAAE